MDASISRSDDVSETTQDSSFHLPPSLKKTLMKGVSPLGPNALPPKTTFGATSKLESLSPQDRKVDHFSMVRHVESWKKYNELGQTIPRQKIATTYGKLLDTPGPADYHPDRTVLSIDESGPKISLHSRVSANIVDKLETPGPGAYNLKATIEPPVELAKGARKTRLITRSPSKPMKEKVGPGFYRPTAKTEFGKFKRETCALMPSRAKGTQPRAVIDKKTLFVRKRTPKRNIAAEETAHLGPGAYFQQPPTEMASSMSTDFTATAPVRWKSPKTFNIDPMSPSASFHSLSWRHERATTPENDPSYTPGPGTYEPDRSMFGTVLLKEGGGAVTRPGKACLSTSQSEGAIPGQHVNAAVAIGYKKPPAKLTSQFPVNSGQTIKGTWRSASAKGANYSSPYSIHTKKAVHSVCRSSGRIAESTVTQYSNQYQGKGSVGAFMRFPKSHATSR